jgi:DNA repair exonuclease SbcCD ATPase subunit
MKDHEKDPLAQDVSNSSASDIDLVDEPAPQGNETESAPDVIEPAISDGGEEELPKEESRARQAFRKFIRWTAGLLIVFGLGFLTAVFTIYNPKLDELNQSQNGLDGARTTIAELEAQINAKQSEINNLSEEINMLNLKVEALETEKQELSEKQDSYNLQITLLQARADVASAQVKIYEENPTQARVLLESASQTLATIETLLPEDLKDVVAPLQTRLELAIGEINNDPETAIIDLGKISGDLREIENAKVWE